MKVNFVGSKTVAIKDICSGTTFVTLRSHSNEGMGMYLKIDSNNNALFLRPRGGNYRYAVNLETGQIREFPYDFKVTPTNTEVNVIN